MGTNYYLHERHRGTCCERCGRYCPCTEPKHIGKSSSGWCFSLHVIPSEGINDLCDWEPYLRDLSYRIVDEYGREVTPDEMLREITERGRDRALEETNWSLSSAGNLDAYLAANHAERGPNNLMRHKLGRPGSCIKHGAGTWDCLDGWFE